MIEVVNMLMKCYGPNCYDLGIKHEKRELTKYKSKNYCQECLNIVINDNQNKQALMHALRSEYKQVVLPSMVYAQIKKYISIGMTYEGMLKTMEWIKTNKNVKFDLTYGIGLIKYYYADHHNYVQKKRDSDVRYDKSVVVIKPPKRKRKQISKISEDDLLE